MRIAIAGATGVVGQHVSAAANGRGHEVVALARSLGVDLGGGPGLAGWLDGVDVVIDVTGVATQRRATSEAFFGTVTRSLVDAEQAAGVGHHVALSIVGIDDVPSGYYAGKRLQERMLSEGVQPWSVLRATQFHEFAEQMLDATALGPFSLVPSARVRPVAAAEVGAALVEVAEAGPSGRVPDLAGPREEQLVAMARAVVAARGARRCVVGLRVPGAAGRAMRDGGLLPTGPGARGSQAFADWVAGRG